MAKQLPLLGEMVHKDEIGAIVSTLGRRGYLAVYDGQKTVVAEAGSPTRCIFLGLSEKAGKQHSVTCTEEADISGNVSALLQDVKAKEYHGIVDSRPCRAVTLHYFFRIPDRFYGNLVSKADNERLIRTAGLIFFGPIINSTEIPDAREAVKEQIQDTDELTDQAGSWQPLEAIPRFSESRIKDLEEHAMACTGILSQRYREATLRRRVWVAMPFAPEFNDVYDFAVSPALTRLGYSPDRVDRIHPDEIMNEIKAGIDRSAFVVADVSGKNSNVMWEVGFAERAPKKVLIITRDQRPFPFSVAGRSIVQYTSGNLAPLVARIGECVRGWQNQGKIPYDYESEDSQQEV